MARLSSELVLSLRDGVSKPAHTVGRSLHDMSAQIDAADRRLAGARRMQAAVTNGVSRAAVAAASSAAGVVTPAALAFAGQQAFTRYASVERAINRIGVTANASAEQVRQAMGIVDQAAYQYAMTQDRVAQGLDALVAAGRSMPEALSFLPSVVATAQAADAEITDIATTADAVGRNFGITGERMQGAFDILVKGGQAGKFELKDMAQYLPSLAPAFEALGYRGEAGLKKIVAGLQVVRNGTGSAGEAATAFQNVIQKMESEETATRFKKMGIDLRKEMTKAQREGKDLLDVFIQLSLQATKGDMSKLPLLFADSEMQGGMRALINGIPDLTRYVNELGSAAGSTKTALDTILNDNQAKIDRMATAWDGLIRSMGQTVAPVVTPIMKGASDWLDRDAAITRGWERETDAGLSGRDVQNEFERRYKENNADYQWWNPIDRAAMVATMNDALEEVGRGNWKTVYDGLDREAKAQKGTGPKLTAPQAYALSGLEAAPTLDGQPVRRDGVPLPRSRGSDGTPTLSPADQRQLYNEGRQAAADLLARSAPRDAVAAESVQRIEAATARIEAAATGKPLPTAPASEEAPARRGPDPVRRAIGAAERVGEEQANLNQARGLPRSYYGKRLKDAQAELADLSAGLPETARRDLEAYAAAVAAGGGQVTTQARQIGENIRSALSVTAVPQVDTSGLDAAQAKVDRLHQSLQALPGAVQGAALNAQRRAEDFEDVNADLGN